MIDDAPIRPPAPATSRPPATTAWLGDRALAPTWKGRAADNLAAIRLLREIEQDDRPATAEEQALLSRFTGFGASELANTLFRRAGEAFRPAGRRWAPTWSGWSPRPNSQASRGPASMPITRPSSSCGRSGRR